MKYLSNKLGAGLVLGFIVQFISFSLFVFFNKQSMSVEEYLKVSMRFKTLYYMGALSSIPNVLLFFWLVNKYKLNIAKGIQYVLIAVVVILAIVKFGIAR